MKPRGKAQRFLISVLAAGLLAALVPPAEAQFNPRGRKKPKTPVTAPRSGPGNAIARPARSGAEKPEQPSSDALIARYTGIVLQQPGAQFPLQRLAELYRQRDGTLDALVADFEQRANRSGPEHYGALVALAGIYKHAGQHERAAATYESAIVEQPKNPVALVALGHLLADRGDKAGARARFESALPHLSAEAEKEQLLRELITLSLDVDDFAGAKRHHEALVQRARGSFYVRAELGRELVARGKYERAVEELSRLVKAATGDNRVLAPALRDLGAAQAKLGKRSEALETLRRALRIAGADAGIRRDIHDVIVEIHRAEGRLPDLVAELERQGTRDAQELRTLGALYEEIGQVDKALATYRRALERDAKDIETRLKVVQLLQIQGELDAAIREYEALIRAAPRNPDFVFRLSEALIQRGDRAKALDQLRKLEARSGSDEQVLAALVDFYERLEEKDLALTLLKRVAQLGSQDPQHLVVLGERYWAEGDKAKAVQTWQRIRLVVPDRAQGLLSLGEVLVEHAMIEEGLDAFKEAVKLGKGALRYKKAYALALERAGAGSDPRGLRRQRQDEARRIWEEILSSPGLDPHAAREARQHVVTLWGGSGDLSRRVPPLEKRFGKQPPDLEAGRLLAEVELRLKRAGAAERTLTRVIELAPGDVASLAQLERVLVQERKLRPAIEVLKKLASADPKRAREYWQRMAQYAAELYSDEEAIEYAARVVELSPDDADGHRKLGQMYLRRQDTERAVQSLRQAIAKNDRLFIAYLELAELLIGRGELDEADRLLGRVVRAAPDDDLVSQAARMSMQLNLGRGTLEQLEHELLPVALGNPQKPLYRRLLVEVYGALALPLVYQANSQDEAAAAKASAALQRIGERAVKPLLDALGDARRDQQRVAIELLSHIRNKGAGAALFAFATGPADQELRVRAMIAAGTLKDPALLPKYAGFLAPLGHARADDSDAIAMAATWGVARMPGAHARPLLLKLLESQAPGVRALAATGLGLSRDASSVRPLVELVRSQEYGPLPRAAAAFALGELGARNETSALAALVDSNDPVARGLALIALARLGAASAPPLIADALVSPDAELRSLAAAAALVHATGVYRAPPEPLPPPPGRVDVREWLSAAKPAGYSPDERALALLKLAPFLANACATAAQSSPERARVVADALLVASPGFGVLAPDLGRASPALRAQAEEARHLVATATVEPFIALTTHPVSEVRVRAVQFLATRAEPHAFDAILRTLDDPDLDVQRVALAALGARRDARAVDALTTLLGSGSSWAVRVRAAEALATAPVGPQRARALAALERAARQDGYALVRDAAVRALGVLDARAAADTLVEVAARDAEPRVRETARRVLEARRVGVP